MITHLLTGDWRHLAEDGVIDLDALPDETLPYGEVTLTPLQPQVARDGTPVVAYTLATVVVAVERGTMSVRLPGSIGDVPVLWRLTSDLQYKGTRIPKLDIEFVLTADTTVGDLVDSQGGL